MKTNILYFLLGILITISVAAGVNNGGLITIKPSTPKSTVVFGGFDNEKAIIQGIRNYAAKGYILK